METMPEVRKDSLENQINEVLIENGWDYEDRKRVLFMLRNSKPRERTMKECADGLSDNVSPESVNLYMNLNGSFRIVFTSASY